MNNEDMKSNLDKANVLLVEKLAEQPYLRLSLELLDSGKWVVGGAYLDKTMKERVTGKLRETPEEAFASIFEMIAALPSPEEAVTRTYLSKVADAVDYARENSIAEEYVAPLRGVSCAMTENLLTHEAAE